MSTPAAPSSGRALVNRVVIPLAAMVIAFGGGWSMGAGRAKTDWATAQVSVSGTTLSATLGGTTYRADGIVAAWRDGDTWHEQTWPTCLSDGYSGEVPVLVSATTVNNHTVRGLVAVDCTKH